MAKLFKEPTNIFKWRDIKTFLLRNQYNETLTQVVNEYFSKQYLDISKIPNFLNTNNCLTLTKFDAQCKCGTDTILNSEKEPDYQDIDLENAKAKFQIAMRSLGFKWQEIELNSLLVEHTEVLNDFRKAFQKREEMGSKLKALKSKMSSESKKVLDNIEEYIKNFDEANKNYRVAENEQRIKHLLPQRDLEEARIEYENAKSHYEIAQREFDFNSTDENNHLQSITKDELRQAEKRYFEIQKKAQRYDQPIGNCIDKEPNHFCLPSFEYLRKLSLSTPLTDKKGNLMGDDILDFNTNGLTVGAVLWLYYYERMGIFKILGALMDDYNYRGKYTLSGIRNNNYSALMDMVCTWHRLGISSNLRDRICLYQRSLGVSIENNLGVDSERNTGFMGTFNKLIDHMLEYYKDKRLANAINTGNTSRSSVATQTSIKDTMELLQQQMEPFQYGRNQINTFLGLATVHATICLLNNVRKEIGIPDQYERPQEFIPAAYDILVAKRPVTLNESNRFLIYDNCASYGFRLLTDIETIDLEGLQISSVGGTFDLWLDDVEGWAEGYRNAYSSVPEGVVAIV